MAKTIPTKEQIDLQIAGLKKEKESLPQFSNLNTDNWGTIDAQLDVLEGLKEPDDFYIDETAEEFEDGDNDIYFAAQRAADWLTGDETESLFSED